MHPFLVPIEVETEIKNALNQTLNNTLRFVKRQDLRAGVLPSLYYRIVTAMLLFRNNV